LSSLVSSPISGDETVDWWRKFPQIKANLNTGLVSGTKLLICGWDSSDGPEGSVVGTADLKSNPSVTHILAPVVCTGRDRIETDVDTQTANIQNEYSLATRRDNTHSVITRSNVKWKNVEGGTQLHYNGFWFSIPVTDLRDGDILQFGGDGTNYKTRASWTVTK
jgi:hypothetical protein